MATRTTRKTLAIDKTATLLLAVVLIAGGLAAGWWWSGRDLGGGRLPGALDAGAVTDVTTSGWFPWVAAVIGVLLALVGLWWIAAHLTQQGVRRLRLAGSRADGRLDVLAGPVVTAAADDFADALGVRSASGSVLRDRGQLVALVRATVEPDADLAALAARADEVSGQLARMLERPDLRCNVELRVATARRVLDRTG